MPPSATRKASDASLANDEAEVKAKAAATLRPFIESLDAGYTLASNGVGLIFHRVGRDVTRRWLNPKLTVFDETHKHMNNPDLTGHIVDVIRQMRRQGVSVLIASQDPPSLPNAIIELSSLVILHRFNSPADLTPAQMASLAPGEAYVWATKATERVFTQKAVKMRFRPRVTRHGGETRRV